MRKLAWLVSNCDAEQFSFVLAYVQLQVIMYQFLQCMLFIIHRNEIL